MVSREGKIHAEVWGAEVQGAEVWGAGCRVRGAGHAMVGWLVGWFKYDLVGCMQLPGACFLAHRCKAPVHSQVTQLCLVTSDVQVMALHMTKSYADN